MKKVEQLEKICINLDLLSIYDVGCLSVQELVYKLIDRLNTVIANQNSNNANIEANLEELRKILMYLLDDGLKEEIVNILSQMYNDGTLQELVMEAMIDLKMLITKLGEELKKEVETREEHDKLLGNALEKEIADRLESDRIMLEKFEAFKVVVTQALEELWNNRTVALRYGIKNNSDISDSLQRYVDDCNAGIMHEKMIVPAGNYTFSKTVVRMNNVSIEFSSGAFISAKNELEGGFFMNADFNQVCYGKSAGGNILIEGGNFDGTGNRGYIVGFALGKDIIVRNMNVITLISAHCFEFSSCDNVTVEGCTIDTNGTHEIFRPESELIQIATQTVAGFPFFGHNSEAIDIPFGNINILNNIFKNSTTGCGSHGAVYGVYETDFTYRGNKFINMSAVGIRPFHVQRCTIEGNEFINCRQGIYADGMIKNVELNRPNSEAPQEFIINSNVFKTTEGGDWDCQIYFTSKLRLNGDKDRYGYCNNITITGNSIDVHSGHGIRFNFVKTANITGNTITSETGMRISRSEHINITGNRVKNLSQDGLGIQLSKDSGYYDDGNGNVQFTISGNQIHSYGTPIGISYTFGGLISGNNIRKESGTQSAININSDSAKISVIGNSEYTGTPQSAKSFEATSSTDNIDFALNVCMGYGNGTTNHSVGGKTLVESWSES